MRVFPHRRSLGKREKKVARNFCHEHSVRAGQNEPGALREIVFGGTAEELAAEVLAAVGADRTGEIPDYPQGMVLHNSLGLGAFD